MRSYECVVSRQKSITKIRSPVIRFASGFPLNKPKFKLAVLVYKALNNMAPQYLTDDCQLLTASHCQLQSSETFKCSVLWTCFFFSDHAFVAARPLPLWNTLPIHIHRPDLTWHDIGCRRWLLYTSTGRWRHISSSETAAPSDCCL